MKEMKEVRFSDFQPFLQTTQSTTVEREITPAAENATVTTHPNSLGKLTELIA